MIFGTLLICFKKFRSEMNSVDEKILDLVDAPAYEMACVRTDAIPIAVALWNEGYRKIKK